MDMDRRSRVIRDLSESGSFAGRRLGDVLRDAYDQGHAAGVELALEAGRDLALQAAREARAEEPPPAPPAPPVVDHATTEQLHDALDRLADAVSKLRGTAWGRSLDRTTPLLERIDAIRGDVEHVIATEAAPADPSPSTLHELLERGVRKVLDGLGPAPDAPWDRLAEITYATLSNQAEAATLAFHPSGEPDGWPRTPIATVLIEADRVYCVTDEELVNLAAHRLLEAVEAWSWEPRPAPTLTPEQVDALIPPGNAPDAPLGDPEDVQNREGSDLPVADPPLSGDEIKAAVSDALDRLAIDDADELFLAGIGTPPDVTEPFAAPAGDEITEEGELAIDDDAPPAAEETP